ncbi:MAG: chemotaxis protein CheA [Anaerolineae bacterium]|nr:chemotaxis protein CheA [Anaerolineae bacterium]
MQLQFDLTPEETEIFLQEAEEHLTRLDDCLVQLEKTEADQAVMQEIFRSAHTLKGSAGAIGHTSLAALTHEMETVLDRLRRGTVPVSPDLVDTLFAALDAIRALVGEVKTRQSSGVACEELVAKLRAYCQGEPGQPQVAAGHTLPWRLPEEATAIADQRMAAGESVWMVGVEIAADSVAPGGRALQVLLALEQAAQVLWSHPRVEELDDAWSQHQVQALVTGADPTQLEQLLNTISEVRCLIAPYTSERETRPMQKPLTGAEDVLKRTTSSMAADSLPSDGKTRWVRTSVERLDKLMNLVGELVTDRNRLFQVRAQMTTGGDWEELLGQLGEALSHLSWITDQLQDEVMRARMVPVAQVFNKFPRMVRELARELGKQVELVIEGQDTELDRSVIEWIGDPLVHLIRNAVDHGIEPPAERTRAGKPPIGRIYLSARSEEHHILVTVEDDGRGIDPDEIRRVAVERGLLDRESAQRLSDGEALELIFAPGFSTARQVTELSGRGVGMDVVRTNVERLNGSVRVSSQRGRGTLFELRLPLTLAIMPALLVSVRGQTYAIPLTSVMSTLRIRPDQVASVLHQGVMVLRDRVLPLLWLEDYFGWRNGHHSATYYVVAIRWGEAQIGLVVDGLLGQQEVVVKPLGHQMGDVPGVAGGTIMGDGRVALILDVSGLVQTTLRERRRTSLN